MPDDNVWSRARRTFLPFHGVVGVGWGPKFAGGKLVTHNAIIVFVERKLPAAEIPSGEQIPRIFEDHATDVRVPRIAPDSKGPRERCLTADVQWIDWAKIDRMWQEQHPRKEPR